MFRMHSKEELRKAMRNRLQTLPDAERTERSTAVCSRIAVLPQYKQAHRIMAFLNMPEEVCLDPLLDQAIREGRELYVPLCISKGMMKAVRLEAVSKAVTGAYGIRTAPAGSPNIDAAELDLILVPGVAFDEHGHRLGHGGGFYDRFLANARPDCIIAAAWDMQIVPFVPAEKHDLPMSAILTEQRYIIYWK